LPTNLNYSHSSRNRGPLDPMPSMHYI